MMRRIIKSILVGGHFLLFMMIGCKTAQQTSYVKAGEWNIGCINPGAAGYTCFVNVLKRSSNVSFPTEKVGKYTSCGNSTEEIGRKALRSVCGEQITDVYTRNGIYCDFSALNSACEYKNKDVVIVDNDTVVRNREAPPTEGCYQEERRVYPKSSAPRECHKYTHPQLCLDYARFKMNEGCSWSYPPPPPGPVVPKHPVGVDLNVIPSAPHPGTRYSIVVGDTLDFDGDGGGDIFTIKDGTWYYSRSGITKWIKLASDTTRNIKELKFGDFNGDGKTDVFALHANGQFLISSGGTQPFTSLNFDTSLHFGDFKIGDFNGDGVADIFRSINGQWNVSYSGLSRYFPLGSDLSLKTSELSIGDFNGDRKSDVFSVVSGHWQYSSGGVSVYTAIGSDLSRTLKDLRFADLDGDGSTDIFVIDNGQWKFSSKGAAAYQSLEVDNKTVDNIYLSDLNGDGTADLFTVENGQWKMSTNARGKYINLEADTADISMLRAGNL
ncbi:MAG: VCBS repeat-containing protein [Proteobacteria bacterium]|nr:MAG: VCBS repeat-containing protein [Pseudomonadota bacterium]